MGFDSPPSTCFVFGTKLYWSSSLSYSIRGFHQEIDADNTPLIYNRGIVCPESFTRPTIYHITIDFEYLSIFVHSSITRLANTKNGYSYVRGKQRSTVYFIAFYRRGPGGIPRYFGVVLTVFALGCSPLVAWARRPYKKLYPMHVVPSHMTKVSHVFAY